MALVDGDDDLTIARARARFFLENGFPPDGGYDDEHAEADFGSVRYRVTNFEARGNALRVHDLHHLATGYSTDWRGEAEISAWELGGGLGATYPYAWITVLFGVFTGILGNLRATFRAFARGRRSENLYGDRFDPAVLRKRLATLRRELRVDAPPPRPRIADAVAFVGWSVVAIAFGVLTLPVVLLMVLDASFRRQCPFAGLSCSGQA